MSKKNHFTVMVRFDPSMFTPVSTADYSFSVLEEEAKKGSDYNNDDVDFDSPIKMMIKMVLMSVACFFMSFLVGKIMRPPSSTKNKKLYKHTDVSAVFNAQWCRTIPFDGNIPFTYYVTSASEKDKEGALIGAYLLRWAKKDYLKFAYTESKGFLGLGKTMQPSVIFALGAQLDMSSNEYLLYCMLFEASGGDAVLQEKEFYNWSRHNYQKVFDWYESVENESERLMMGSGLLQEEERRAFLLYKVKDITLTQQGAQKACEVYGFKNYLKDFTIINERRPVEVELWDDYLVFATLFGIADEVAKEFKDIYPDHFAQMSMSYGGSGMDMYATMQIVRSVYYAGRHGADVGRPSSVGSSSGGGGGSSGGGGGGSSGGGSGGGSR